MHKSKKDKERAEDVKQRVVASETLPRVVSTDIRKGKNDLHVQNEESLVNLPPNAPELNFGSFPGICIHRSISYWNLTRAFNGFS